MKRNLVVALVGALFLHILYFATQLLIGLVQEINKNHQLN